MGGLDQFCRLGTRRAHGVKSSSNEARENKVQTGRWVESDEVLFISLSLFSVQISHLEGSNVVLSSESTACLVQPHCHRLMLNETSGPSLGLTVDSEVGRHISHSCSFYCIVVLVSVLYLLGRSLRVHDLWSSHRVTLASTFK